MGYREQAEAALRLPKGHPARFLMLYGSGPVHFQDVVMVGLVLGSSPRAPRGPEIPQAAAPERAGEAEEGVPAMSITIQSTGEPLPGIWHLTRSARDYDEATDMVVIAHTSQEARRLAADECQAEGREPWLSGRRSGRPFARIYRIGTARRNPNGSVPKSRLVVRNGTWSG